MRAKDFASLPRRLTMTVDVEDHTAGTQKPARYPSMTLKLLDFLSERGLLSTFFVVGDVARRSPELVRAIVAAGHEIGSHSHRHVPLARENAAKFSNVARDSRRFLEDLAGTPVTGFRAPVFSLVPATAWAIDALAEAGFRYSSSVLPVAGPGGGWPGAPCDPFRWPNGLMELPCPVGRVGPLRLPFLGGTYLRYLPPWRLRQAARRCSTETVWAYCHPYDVDTEERFRRLPEIGLISSLFLWCNRGSMLHRLEMLLEGRISIPLARRLDELTRHAQTFIPA